MSRVAVVMLVVVCAMAALANLEDEIPLFDYYCGSEFGDILYKACFKTGYYDPSRYLRRTNIRRRIRDTETTTEDTSPFIGKIRKSMYRKYSTHPCCQEGCTLRQLKQYCNPE